MDSGYYAAMTGLVARTQALDTAAANLANAQTPGYRAEREFFRSVLLGPDAADSQLGATVNNYGLLGGDRLSMAQGALEPTGNPLDLAIEGQGFFMEGSCCFQTRLFRQQPRLHIGQKVFQMFQVVPVGKRFLSERSRVLGLWRWVAQAFRGPQKLAEDVGKVLRPDARTMPSFRTETKHCGTQVVVHLPQGCERIGRHYPFQSMPAKSCATSNRGSGAPEVTTRSATVVDGFSACSTCIHASRTASKSVITWAAARFEG